MATVSAGPAGPLNMLSLQVAQLQYGSVPIYNASQIRVDNGGGRFADFFGSFTYPSGGGGGGMDPYGYAYAYDQALADVGDYYPSSGTISRLTETTGAGVSLDVNGLGVDAPTLFNFAKAGAGDAILNLVFGGSDQMSGTAGADWLDGYGGDDLIQPGAGNDSVRGLDGNDTIEGIGGADDLNGNRGEDIVRGGDDNDIVRGGQGADTVFGDAGDDPHVNGNIGDDIVRGGTGNDQVFGGQGADQLFGEDGNDSLSGDLGDDVLNGGAGADRFLFRVGSGRDVAADFDSASGDRVQLAAGQAFTLSTVGGSTVVDLGGGDALTLSGVAQASLGDWLVFA